MPTSKPVPNFIGKCLDAARRGGWDLVEHKPDSSYQLTADWDLVPVQGVRFAARKGNYVVRVDYQLSENTNRYSLRVATLTMLPPGADPQRLWWLILPESAKTYRLKQGRVLQLLEDPALVPPVFDQLTGQG